jgi:hypothetical protein
MDRRHIPDAAHNVHHPPQKPQSGLQLDFVDGVCAVDCGVGVLVWVQKIKDNRVFAAFQSIKKENFTD